MNSGKNYFKNLIFFCRHPVAKMCQNNLTNWKSRKYLLPWSASETVWVELVGMKDVDGTFNAEMMELTGDL